MAVSGGIDSVVLLDILARSNDRAVGTSALSELQGEGRSLELTSKEQAEGLAPPRIIIAHVDHGIREDSSADARFVEALAARYGLPCLATHLALGAGASEDTARQARYAFLYEKAREFKAQIVTAHHLDDVIGSMAINTLRGTGWRGLAVMSRSGIGRPLLGWTKRQVYDYALEHRLEWVEDSTNRSDAYLRNRLRGSIVQLPAATKTRLMQLRAQQQILAHDIDQACRRLLERQAGSRYFYTMIESTAAIELLRQEIEAATGMRPTAVQAMRALQNIKTGRAGTRCDVSDGVQITVTRSTFVVARHLR